MINKFTQVTTSREEEGSKELKLKRTQLEKYIATTRKGECGGNKRSILEIVTMKSLEVWNKLL